MDKKQPLLSIIIPTRNRIQYAICAINTILLMPFIELELVVQDNSDSCELANYLSKNISDNRLKYNYVAKRLSFIENFNQAVSKASGEYICLIGDDDGINPEIIEAVKWAKTNNINAIKPGLQAQYLWPGVNLSTNKANENSGTLSISYFTCVIQIFDTQKEILKLMDNGGQDYYNINLPKLYHGIVKRECMDKVRNITGHYFGGLTPDIYIVVALSNIVDKVVSIDYPLTIPGICKGSGSVDLCIGKLEDAPHFNGHVYYKWADEVPRFYCAQTIWADSAIAALKDTNRIDLLKRFNIEMLAASCITKHFLYTSEILKGMYHAQHLRGSNSIWGTLKFLKAIFVGSSTKLYSRIINRIRVMIKVSPITKYGNLNNIKEATDTLSEYLNINGLSFQKIIKNYKHEVMK